MNIIPGKKIKDNSKLLKEKLLFNKCKDQAMKVIETHVALHPEVCAYTAVIIKPARGPFVQFLKENSIGDRAIPGSGYEADLSDFVGIIPDLQSIEIKEKAMDKIAEILNRNGINCHVRVHML